ncbi:MAG: RdgB/HAM1 family non-canonical purine NTP pyrophosphatase [Candidatus Aminicenantes bacterium]|nr:RdgB/HAM1 family non-canonical purine NTP pyrophosphatase [Candidatus Aminicenantes bacterium]
MIATTNRGKAREIAAAFSSTPVRFISLIDAGIESVCPETGKTLEANARAKAEFYSRKSGLLTLAEDSGLEIEALRGRPGVHSARFSGPGATDPKNVAKVLHLLASVPRSGRRARFVCVMALARDGRILDIVRGIVHGTIAPEARGSAGFGYDPIFYYHPLRKTFAELAPDEKNAVSHRGRTLAAMKPRLLRFLPE